MCAAFQAAGCGSSPRERGTICLDSRPRPAPRFIPARAGNNSSLQRWSRRYSVHPRASGEQVIALMNELDAAGSSPRERGTIHLAPRRIHAVRFIPARAGNNPTPGRCRAAKPVHPRASGEQVMSVVASCAQCGSSPRERGTIFFKRLDLGGDRFIPARAGNKQGQG